MTQGRPHPRRLLCHLPLPMAQDDKKSTPLVCPSGKEEVGRETNPAEARSCRNRVPGSFQGSLLRSPSVLKQPPCRELIPQRAPFRGQGMTRDPGLSQATIHTLMIGPPDIASPGHRHLRTET